MIWVVVCVSDCLILFQSVSIPTSISIFSSISLPSFKYTCSSLSNTSWYYYIQSRSCKVSRSHLIFRSPLCLYKFDNFSIKTAVIKNWSVSQFSYLCVLTSITWVDETCCDDMTISSIWFTWHIPSHPGTFWVSFWIILWSKQVLIIISSSFAQTKIIDLHQCHYVWCIHFQLVLNHCLYQF